MRQIQDKVVEPYNLSDFGICVMVLTFHANNFFDNIHWQY